MSKSGSSISFQASNSINESYSNNVIDAGFDRARVFVEAWVDEWSKAVKTRIEDLIRLPNGWDGYQGRPLSFELASFVASMLEKLYLPGIRVPSLVPGSDGSVQIEWHYDGWDIELDVLGIQDVQASCTNFATNETEEQTISNDFTIVFQWLERLNARTEEYLLAA